MKHSLFLFFFFFLISVTSVDAITGNAPLTQVTKLQNTETFKANTLKQVKAQRVVSKSRVFGYEGTPAPRPFGRRRDKSKMLKIGLALLSVALLGIILAIAFPSIALVMLLVIFAFGFFGLCFLFLHLLRKATE